MSLIMLFLTFLYVGLFTIGGGMSTIALLENICVGQGLVTSEEFFQMVAISESTPGPIGINIATYVGYLQGGVLGGILASIGLIALPFAICALLIKILDKFSKKPVVRAAFIGLRAVTIGLIASSALSMIKVTLLSVSGEMFASNFTILVNYKECIIFVIIAATYFIFKKHPLIYIAAGAILGILIL